MKKGILIVFSGIDGSGKTTQAKLLLSTLAQSGKRAEYVWCRWDPFLPKIGIRMWKRGANVNSHNNYQKGEYKERKLRLLSNPIFCAGWFLIFFLDYGMQVYLKVTRLLFTKDIIISDRIHFDSFVDQEVNLRGVNKSLISGRLFHLILLFFPQPDLTFFIDTPAEVALCRKNDGQNLEYLKERREVFKELSDKLSWYKVDGSLPKDKIALEISAVVGKKLESILIWQKL